MFLYYLKQKLQSGSRGSQSRLLYRGPRSDWFGGFKMFPTLSRFTLLATLLQNVPGRCPSLFLPELIVAGNCDLPQDAALLH